MGIIEDSNNRGRLAALLQFSSSKAARRRQFVRPFHLKAVALGGTTNKVKNHEGPVHLSTDDMGSIRNGSRKGLLTHTAIVGSSYSSYA